MTIEISILPSPSPQSLVAGHESFQLHFIAKDEECRRLWTMSATNDAGELEQYPSVQHALMAATEKMATYSI